MKFQAGDLVRVKVNRHGAQNTLGTPLEPGDVIQVAYISTLGDDRFLNFHRGERVMGALLATDAELIHREETGVGIRSTAIEKIDRAIQFVDSHTGAIVAGVWLVFLSVPIGRALYSSHFRHFIERTHMNLSAFFDIPAIQNANVIAYDAILGLFVSLLGLMFFKYSGKIPGQIADWRRQVRWAEEDRREKVADKERHIGIDDDKRRKEEEQKANQAKKVAKRERRERLEREESRQATLVAETLADSLKPMIEAIKSSQTVQPSPLLHVASEFEHATRDERPITPGCFVRFHRTTTNYAKIYDSVTREERPATTNDCVQVSEITDNGRLGYLLSNGKTGYAVPADVRVIA